MTIRQIKQDALFWCRYFAANESVTLPEVSLLFFEAYQTVYREAVISNPEFFRKSVAIAGASFAIPTDLRQEEVLVVDDAACTQGYAKVVDNDEWSVRQSNSRLKGTTSSPLARKDTAIFTLSNSITGGTMYYLRTYAETDFADDTQDMGLFLPILFHTVLLSEMQRLLRMRHVNSSDVPTESERRMSMVKASHATMKRALKPLEIVEGLTEKPQSVSSGG